jgi:hypothetical protein
MVSHGASSPLLVFLSSEELYRRDLKPARNSFRSDDLELSASYGSGLISSVILSRHFPSTL